MNEQQLKERLIQISQSGYPLPPEPEQSELVQSMFAHLGSTDSELRDDLIYSTFDTWTVADRLPVERYRELFSTSIDEQHLFFHLGERDTDSVFTRTFSLLVLALALYAHTRRPYLTSMQVLVAKQRTIEYLQQEQDRRGYVEGKGWAHSIAHAADVIKYLARCPELVRPHLGELLRALQSAAVENKFVYAHGEDERLSVAAVSVLQRGLLEQVEWEQWLNEFVAQHKEQAEPMEIFHRQLNIQHFLRACYFRVGRLETNSNLRPELKDFLLNHIKEVIVQTAHH